MPSSLVPSYRRPFVLIMVIAALLAPALPALAEPASALSAQARAFEHRAQELSRTLPLWSGLPFAGMLLSIALFPLVAPRFWHKHYAKVAIGWALAFFAPFYIEFGSFATHKALEVLLVDYVPFVILLWGLYTVSGGIYLRATLVATPRLNVAFLAVGTVLASLMGTTGAAMLLVRPLLRANHWRRSKAHVFIFFTFLVANVGGLLTPLGDPPLFLGFLHGVPFFWTLRLLPEYLLVSTVLLTGFFVLDRHLMRRELDVRPSHEPPHKRESFRIEGGRNFLLLFGILGSVLLSGVWKPGGFEWFGIHFGFEDIVRDLLIIIVGLLSLVLTQPKVREDNQFNWHAMTEVAYLFFGIFVTIVPVLMILQAGTQGNLGWLIASISRPWQYFWITGALSSFLDNAPTYLTFFALALGQVSISPQQVTDVLNGVITGPQAAQFVVYLKAVSTGAVFMGANTYIGNAPNFMVLSIARSQGVRMPSFFGYMLWAGAFLLPTFAIVSLLWF
ncbi:MAG: sodium:proton antiporter [Acidobacteriota bacterium]